MLCLLVMFQASSGAQAQEPAAIPPVIVDAKVPDLDVSASIAVLPDPDGKLSLDQVRSPEIADKFKRLPMVTPAFGGVDGAYWGRIDLVNADPSAIKKLLAFDQTYYRHFTLYIEAPDGSLVRRDLNMGDNHRDVDRDWLTPIFELDLKPGTTRLYIRIEFHLITFGLHLRDETAQLTDQTKLIALYTAAAASLVLVLLVTLAFMIATRSLHYLPFAAYVSSVLLGNVCGVGAARYFIGESLGSVAYLLVPIELVAFLFLWFIRRFLRLASRFPRHNMAFMALGAFNVVQYLLLVFHPAWNGPTMPLVNVALIATSISTVIHLGWRSREGLTFTFGLLPIFFSGTVAVSLFSGLLAQNVQTQILIIVPVVLAIVLFAYGIGMQTGAQIRAARQRLEASEDSLIRMNDHLEQLVEKRTRHLREAQDQLVQAEKLASLGGLVAGVAHEINTPLGVGLTGASHALDRANELKRQVDTGAIKRSELTSALTDIVSAGEIVIKNLNRADHLVQSFKRIAADQTSERPETIDLGQYIQDVLRSLEPTIKRAQVDVQADLPDGLRLTTQPGAIAQVVTNLIQNAIIHAFEGIEQPRIKISVAANVPGNSEGADLLTITVADNGRGMSDDVRAKAFDPFFTTKRGTGGTGLGLHIVHNLVAGVLGGALNLSSTLGQGTTFTIDLPRNYVRA